MTGWSAAVLATVFILVGGTLALGTGSVAGHPSGSVYPAASDSITVTAVADYHYQPDTIEQVATNSTITVTFADDDALPHSFTISSREGFEIPISYNPTELNQLFTTYPALYSVLLNGSGEQNVGTFHSPTTPGWYEFICNVSGHFQSGMFGFIAFGENLPSNLTSPPRIGLGGTNITPIDAAALGALVAAIVVGVAFWRRRRSTPRMSSEPARDPKADSGRAPRR